jgi:hypothetical protein
MKLTFVWDLDWSLWILSAGAGREWPKYFYLHAGLGPLRVELGLTV